MGMFDGKVALVTGAASGIGRASVQLFAEHGAAVMASDVNDAGGAETVRLVREAGGTAEYVHADVAKSADVRGMVDATIAAFGRLDFAHNNAGIPGLGLTIPDYPEEEWDRGIGVMLTGVFLGMKYQIPRILEHGDGGAIVNTSSGAGLIGFPGMCPYVAAKHGVIGLTKTAALEFGAQGVRINSICPGTARTGMVERMQAAADGGAVVVFPDSTGDPLQRQVRVVCGGVWGCRRRNHASANTKTNN